MLIGACVALYPPTGNNDRASKPYHFKYNIDDKEGNSQSRYESADGSGTVTGHYSYRLANGIFRRVKYIADGINGFRAYVESNEPGVGDDSPADVMVSVKPAPYGVDRQQGQRRSYETLLTSHDRQRNNQFTY